MTRARQRGVTLMELLIAVTLLSLLSVGMLFALRIGLNVTERTNSRLLTNRRVLGVERIMTRQIAGYLPANAELRPQGGGAPQRVPFFQGEPGTMRFVSTFSLQEGARGYARILEYQVIAGEDGRGVRLVLNELLYTGPQSTGLLTVGLRQDPASPLPVPMYRPVETGPGSFVLADKLAHCQFFYKMEVPEDALKDRWLPRWVLPYVPAAVRIDMAPLEPDASRLQVPSITARFHVDRDPTVVYRQWE
jgi:general secretion pathway protein J